VPGTGERLGDWVSPHFDSFSVKTECLENKEA
jgi:hypothetical protein